MTETTTKTPVYNEALSLSSLMQILSGLNPYAVLYSDPLYGIDQFGASYYPDLKASPDGRDAMAFRSVLAKKPVTVGEFLTFLRESVEQLGNEGHTVNPERGVWMAFKSGGLLPSGGGRINGITINGDGSFTLSQAQYKYWQ